MPADAALVDQTRSAIAAVAGVLYGAKDGFVSPDICTFQQSIMVLAMVILGGLGNSYGALLGAAQEQRGAEDHLDFFLGFLAVAHQMQQVSAEKGHRDRAEDHEADQALVDVVELLDQGIDARLVEPQRFNTWPLVNSVLPRSQRHR